MLLYDLFPDVLVLAGKIRAGSFWERTLAKVTRYALNESEATVFLGEHLRHYAEAKYGPAKKSVVIPVGAPGEIFVDSSPRRLPPEAAVSILYAGAMGHMHEVETLRELFSGGLPAGIKWRFHSSGSGYRRLRESLGSYNLAERESLLFAGPLADKEWAAAMLDSPIALVTLRLGAENLVMPSKTYSALVAGQAILAVCARHSDLAKLIERHDCGWVVEPGDVAGLRDVLRTITSAPSDVYRKRLNAFVAGHEFYSAKVVARQWEQLFTDINPSPKI